MKQRAILFDFFGVICSELAPVWLEKYLPQEDAAKVKAEIFTLADMGMIDENEMYCRLHQATNIPVKQIRAEWKELISIDSAVVDMIRFLRTSYKVYLLSNSVASVLHDILQPNNLYSLFDKIYISSEIGKIKPHADFFLYVLEDLHLEAEDSIMIDDNPSNIQGAEAAGIHGIVYTSVESLIEELNKLGVKIHY